MEASRISSKPVLAIRLLGGFQAEINGVPIDKKSWSRRSAESLVKLLAIKPLHTLHREQVMDLLWMEQTPEAALNNLNKAIHSARRAFEPKLAKGLASKFILTPKNQIVLASPGVLRVDLDEFERLANYALKNNALETGQKALELYRGDLLLEDIYEDWIYTRRESMRILFRKTATKTAELFAAEGNYQPSIEILKKLVTDDASDEYVHRLLMRYYAETGSKYQALKQFEQCRAALHKLGIEPDSETVKLQQTTKRGEILPAANKYQVTPQNLTTPHITPLTFRNGIIKSARFLPDGETIIFSAEWNSAVSDLYRLEIATGETRSLGTENAEILSVSLAGNLAVTLNSVPFGFYKTGTLANLSATGGQPTEILREIQWADWHPSKNSHLLAVVRDRDGKNCLEFPLGNVICETEGWIGQPRFSPDGKRIAFIEYPLTGDDRGRVVVLELENKTVKEKQILTKYFLTVQGLAWAGGEVWFTASSFGSSRSIKGVNLKGETRDIYRATGNLTLHDISADGKILVTNCKSRVQIAARRAVDETERDLSWHDWTLPRHLTDDGQMLLFEEGGTSGGQQFAAYTRNTDGSSVKKIGDGSALALSPDGKYALLRFHNPTGYLTLNPTGEGKVIRLETDPANPLVYEPFASFFPDGKRIIFAASDTGGNKDIYVQSIEGGKPVRFKTDQKGVKKLSGSAISPDGKYVVLTDSEKRLTLFQTADGASSLLKNMEKNFYLIRWSGDGKSLFIWQRKGIPATVYKYDLASGKKEDRLRLIPKDTTGVTQFGSIKLTPDGKTYAYSYLRESSELFLMEHLR